MILHQSLLFPLESPTELKHIGEREEGQLGQYGIVSWMLIFFCSLINSHRLLFVAQLPSCVWLFSTPWAATRQASLSFSLSWSLLKFMSIDAIQPSHPPLPFSLFAFNLSQHQGLSKWIGCSHQVAKVLELRLQHQSFQWTFRVDFF